LFKHLVDIYPACDRIAEIPRESVGADAVIWNIFLDLVVIASSISKAAKLSFTTRNIAYLFCLKLDILDPAIPLSLL